MFHDIVFKQHHGVLHAVCQRAVVVSGSVRTLAVVVINHVLTFCLGKTAEHNFDSEFEFHRLLSRANNETGELEGRGGGDQFVRLELNDAKSVRVAIVSD